MVVTEETVVTMALAVAVAMAVTVVIVEEQLPCQEVLEAEAVMAVTAATVELVAELFMVLAAEAEAVMVAMAERAARAGRLPPVMALAAEAAATVKGALVVLVDIIIPLTIVTAAVPRGTLLAEVGAHVIAIQAGMCFTARAAPAPRVSVSSPTTQW